MTLQHYRQLGHAKLLALTLMVVSIVAGLSGQHEVHFWTTLILLGLGWNFGFVGASTLVLHTHTSEEKARVQSFNDFVVFGTVAVGSFLSGELLTTYGWSMILWLSFIPLAAALLILLLPTSNASND